MYLKNLEEEEKIGFLEMAYSIANSDDEFSQTEIDMIALFREEMLLSEENYKIKNISLEDSLDIFSKSSITNKKIVVLEILGIVLADDIVAQEEEMILKKIISDFKLDEEFLEKSKKVVLDLKSSYKNLNELFL